MTDGSGFGLRLTNAILQGRKLTKFLRQNSQRRGLAPTAIRNFHLLGGR